MKIYKVGLGDKKQLSRLHTILEGIVTDVTDLERDLDSSLESSSIMLLELTSAEFASWNQWQTERFSLIFKMLNISTRNCLKRLAQDAVIWLGRFGYGLTRKIYRKQQSIGAIPLVDGRLEKICMENLWEEGSRFATYQSLVTYPDYHHYYHETEQKE